MEKQIDRFILNRFFDPVSFTYTYLIASGVGGKAIIIDPVDDNVDIYMAFLKKLNLKLMYAIDTHTHADHLSGLKKLRDLTQCTTAIGEKSLASLVGVRLQDGQKLVFDNLELKAIYTPGHTDDSYSLLFENYLFTGDILLIGGSGRTDFQNGSPYAAYDSIFHKILKLPENTIILPAHDYSGNTMSTLSYEKEFNPRLQVNSAEEYAKIMMNLNLPNPKMMDVAVPYNISLGSDINKYVLPEEELESGEFRIMCEAKSGIKIIDLREANERELIAPIPGSIHIPYTEFQAQLNHKQSTLHQCLDSTPDLSKIVLLCAQGERSAIAIDLLRKAGYSGMRHLKKGIAGLVKK